MAGGGSEKAGRVMIANRELGIDDYLAIARRRLLWVLIPGIVGPLTGFLISFALTPAYTSTSLLLVEQQLLPTGYVNPIVTEHASDRMITLQQNVLSRSRVQPLVTRLGLVRKGKSVDEIVDQIRTTASVSPYRRTGTSGTAGTNDVSGFHVSYTSDNPRDAQQVCAEITSLLLTENQELREQVARTTTDFLARQLEQSKHNLDEMETRLSQFKIQHFGRMPGDLEANLRILASMNSQLDASTQTISRLQQEKSHTQMLLDQELAALKSAQAAPLFPSVRQQLMRLQDQLVILQTRYTDDFPDVVKTKHEIDLLQAKLKAMNAEANQSDSNLQSTVPREGAKLEPSQIMALREQLYRNDRAIDRATEAQKKLQDRIDLLQSRSALDPAIEEEWKQLTRDNATAHNLYNQLLADKSTAEISTAMERDQEGEQLKLVDPASLPTSPSYPIRWKFAMYGLAAGLGLGLGVAAWLEIQDKAIRSEADVIAALELPMLGEVSWIEVPVNGNGHWNGHGHGNGNGKGNGNGWRRYRSPFLPLPEEEEERAADI
jgi:polysaccharide chain length determinant protein (PEP-CTERM system associated)